MVRSLGVRISAALLLGLVACGCACSDPARIRDGGARDAAIVDAASMDAATMDAALPIDAAPPIDARSIDAPAPTDASVAVDAGTDAAMATDAGCAPGAVRACTLTCATGGTAMGVERCIGGDAWTACARSPEVCGNGVDDDLDGTVDEGCRVEGGCMWLRPQCGGIMSLNDWCASAGGLRLVAGRRCEVAGGGVVALDAAYGAFPLCCCDRVSMCVPECTDASCSGCVVWDEIQCCP